MGYTIKLVPLFIKIYGQSKNGITMKVMDRTLFVWDLYMVEEKKRTENNIHTSKGCQSKEPPYTRTVRTRGVRGQIGN